MVFHGFVCELSTYKKKGGSMLEGDNKIGSLIALAMISLKSSSVFSIKGTTKSIHTFNGRINFYL